LRTDRLTGECLALERGRGPGRRDGDGGGDGELREAGEGRRGHLREGVQGARQAHGAAGGAEEDAAGDGGGGRPVDGAARGVAAADALAEHVHRQVRARIISR
jgi:hypothetical protein